MGSRCNYRKECHFYITHKRNVSALKKGWIDTFCHNSSNSSSCERIRMFKESGVVPPVEIGPVGEAVVVNRQL